MSRFANGTRTENQRLASAIKPKFDLRKLSDFDRALVEKIAESNNLEGTEYKQSATPALTNDISHFLGNSASI